MVHVPLEKRNTLLIGVDIAREPVGGTRRGSMWLKGYLNQNAFLARNQKRVADLHADPPLSHVIVVNG